jgi:PAS domain S-box-containing protein
VNSPSDQRLILGFRRLSLLSSIGTLSVGLLVLIGWNFDIETIKSVIPGLTPMNPTTALIFILAGGALWLSQMGRFAPQTLVIGRWLALVTASLGLIKLGGYLLGVDVGFDQILFRSKLGFHGDFPLIRIAPNTALNFFLIGTALFLLDRRSRGGGRPADYLTLPALIVAFLALTGYAYGVKPLYGVTSFTPMSLTTAIGFIVLCAGVYSARPDQGWMAVVTGDNLGGAAARRLLPLVIGIPMILGWIRLSGQRAGFYGTEFGVSILAVTNIVILAMLVWWSCAVLNRADAERKHSDHELFKQTRILKSILASIGEGVVVADLNGNFTVWNPAAERIINLGPMDGPADEWTKYYGVYLPDQVTPYPVEKLPLARAIGGESVDDDEQFLRHAKAPQGIWLSVTGRPLIDEQGALVGGVVIIHDITQRKAADEKFRRAEAFQNSIVENIPNMIFVKEADALRFVRFNKAGEDLLGYPREDLIGKNDHDFFPKEEADLFTAKDREVFLGEKVVDIPEEAIQTRHHGRRILHTKKMPLFDNSGKPLYLLGISEDITDRKTAEEETRKLNDQLAATNEELEAFSYSVSHDLRAPLRGIDGFSQALLEDYADKVDETGRDYLRRVRAAAQRMSQLIDAMLDLSRVTRSPMTRDSVNLSGLVKSIGSELMKSQPDRRVDFKVEPGLTVDGDTRLLRVMFENLLANAWKFTSKHPTATIEFGRTDRDGTPAYFVRDDGAGFDGAFGGKLFGAFQRLHSIDEFPGTGIGLATVQRIVHRHDGRVWAEGQTEKGATFYFTL